MWSAWLTCSKTCGDGYKTRERTCYSYCDTFNSSDLSDTGTCNEGDCELFS